jgi:SIR2-like protein
VYGQNATIGSVLLVIFGAGASYDSDYNLRPPVDIHAKARAPESGDRPPLADELFENRPEFVEVMKKFGRCRQVIHRLRKNDVNVEKELAVIQAEAVGYAGGPSELAAIRYYIRFAIHLCVQRWNRRHSGLTNYAALLREIEHWRQEFGEQVAFVTFNYDTMLEDAMSQVLGFTINDFASYISQPNYSVFKLHGSTNWARIVNVSDSHTYDYDRVISRASDLTQHVTEIFKIVNGLEMLRDQEWLIVPALALPVDKKDEFSCPREHVDGLAKLVPQVTKILIVGWRATEEKFLEMLRSPLTGLKAYPPLMIVSGNLKDADKTFKNLGSKITHTCGPLTTIETGFSGLIMDDLGEMKDWLRSGKKAVAV